MPRGIKNIKTGKTGSAVLKNVSVNRKRDGKALLTSVSRNAKEAQARKKKDGNTGVNHKHSKKDLKNSPANKVKISSDIQGSNIKKEFDVFICHTERDKPKVKRIINDFVEHDIKYWVDHEKVSYGGSIINAIEYGLNNSRYILVVLSKNFKNSNWCRKEYEPILHKEYNRKENRVIPLTLDGCTDDDIPSMLYGKKNVNYANKKDFKEFIHFLKQ